MPPRPKKLKSSNVLSENFKLSRNKDLIKSKIVGKYIDQLGGGASVQEPPRQSEEKPQGEMKAGITGSVHTAESGYAIAGVQIAAAVPRDTSRRPAARGEMVEIGRSVSAADGSFALEINVPAQNLAPMSRMSPEFNFFIQCTDIDGTVLSQTGPIAFTPGVIVNAAIPSGGGKPAEADWKELSAKILQYQTARMADIAEELSSLAPNGLFASWTAARRLRMLDALEAGFLDPENKLAAAGLSGKFSVLTDAGRLMELRNQFQGDPKLLKVLDGSAVRARAFGSLLQVDSFLDPIAFKNGKINDGINENVVRLPGDQYMHDRFPWLQSPLAGYRDYLLDLWIKTFTGIGPDGKPDAGALMARLTNRFHQDFTTRDTAEVPANRILCGIMKTILAAKTGPYFGFGMSVASIPDQMGKLDREYLDQLISLTHLKQHEIENRYRINLRRSDAELSSPVQQNIETLQRLFTDSYQSVPDSVAVKPPLNGMEQTIIPVQGNGVGPFFLEYEEWLERDAPFYGENHFDIRMTFSWSTDGRKETGDAINANSVPLVDFLKQDFDSSKFDPESASYDKERMKWQWIRNYLDLQGLIQSAHDDCKILNYVSAEQKYLQARDLAGRMRHFIRWINAYDPRATASWQKKYAIRNMNELIAFERVYYVFFGWHHGVIPEYGDYTGNVVTDKWLGTYLSFIAYLVDHLEFRLLPACLAETRFALGRFHDAAIELMGPASFDAFSGSMTDYGGFLGAADQGPLPYGTYSDQTKVMGDSFIPGMTKPTNPVEVAFFRLKLGEVLLEWADTLYRTNEPASIMRARELYKGVLFLHGEDPMISPIWERDFIHDFAPGFGINNLWVRSKRNPAVVTQVNRAKIGFQQIQDEVNYYGYKPNYVPAVRYRVLKEAADRFTTSAKSAQSDFLTYLGKLDTLVVEEMTARTMVQKASAGIGIAKERAGIAQFFVKEAQKQVDAVNAQIAAKEKEIADSESFMSQATSFFSGMGDAVKGMATSAGGMMDEGAGAAASSEGLSAGDAASLAGSSNLSADSAALGAGVGMFTAFAVFAYAGYTSMDGLANAGEKRRDELKHLKEAALPAAKALVTLKQREVTIAQLEQEIAEADYQLGKDLLSYYSTRFLNRAFWVQMSLFSNRLMRRYVDIAGRTAWFAERALAFEQDRELAIIGFDYFPRDRRGVTGADLLGLHLAELESARIQGLSETIPVKRTISMARNYPAAFALLKNTGRCNFMTLEQPLRIDHPGVYGYRIRCVTVVATYTQHVAPHRGMLTNQGVSFVSRKALNSSHALIRFEDALPLSEFRMRQDMFVYDLPDATLLPFEGSGIETLWELSLSKNSTPAGMDKLTDLLITFDLRANYSAALETQHRAAIPATVPKLAVFSGRVLSNGALRKFRKAGAQLALSFDLEQILKEKGENNIGKISNIAAIAAGIKDNLKASVSAPGAGKTVPVELTNGVALSNAGELAGGNGGVPLPLNDLAGENAAQEFKIVLKRAGNAGIDFSKLADVLLAVEYETGN